MKTILNEFEFKSYDLIRLKDGKPILVSKEPLYTNSYFLNNGKVSKIIKRYRNDNNEMEILDDGYKTHLEKDILWKVIAQPQNFGYFCSNGPPHDHNEDWKYGLYLEQFLPIMIENKQQIWVLTREACPNYDGKHIDDDCSCKSGFIQVPLLRNGKIIMADSEFLFYGRF